MNHRALKGKKIFPVYVLWLLLAFQAISGIAGGLVMLLDPSGKTLSVPLIFLMGSPFSDYFFPGLFLLFFLGLFPLLGLVGLIFDRWSWPNLLNIYQNKRWGWTYSLYTGLILIIWMDLQIGFIGYWHPVQTFHALTGVAIVIITLLPPVKDYYQTRS